MSESDIQLCAETGRQKAHKVAQRTRLFGADPVSAPQVVVTTSQQRDGRQRQLTALLDAQTSPHIIHPHAQQLALVGRVCLSPQPHLKSSQETYTMCSFLDTVLEASTYMCEGSKEVRDKNAGHKQWHD